MLLPPTADKRCGSFSHQNTARLLVTEGEKGRTKGGRRKERKEGGEGGKEVDMKGGKSRRDCDVNTLTFSRRSLKERERERKYSQLICALVSV